MSDQRQANEHDALIPDTEVGTEKIAAASSGHRKSYSVDMASSPITRRTVMTQMRTRHRKHMSSVSEMLHTLEPIREDFKETGKVLRRSFVRRLDEMDRGETGFFDMSMTRSMSILPDDMTDLAEEFGMDVSDEAPAISGPPLFQYLALFSAVVAVSSNSTALHMLDGVSAPLKLYWRMTATYIALAPLAFRSLHRDGIPTLNVSEWMTFGAAALAYSTHACLFVSALDFTTIGNAVIFANSQALLLIIGKACVGERIHIFEAIGVVIAFAGAILCSVDSEGAADDAEASALALIGNMMALGSAASGVAYFIFAKAVRSRMPVTLFMFSVMFVGSFMVLSYIALTDGDNLEFSMDPYVGIGGWLDMAEGRLSVVVFLALVCNLVGTMGFVRAMEYFDNIVIAVATLMEPLIASLIAYSFHAGLLPGPLGWVGNLLVVLGTLGVVYPSIGKGGDGVH